MIKGITIKALCSSVPQNEIDNKLTGGVLFGEEIGKVIRSTGIEKRRLSQGDTSLDLCVKAANDIFENTNISRNSIGAVIFVTFNPDYCLPNNASICQSVLELPDDVLAYDINHACSGYPYGLYNAVLTAKATNKNVLLLDGDRQSTNVSNHDKSTTLLFSDAGSATIIGPTDSEYDEMTFKFYTDGSRHEALLIEDGGNRNPISNDSIVDVEQEDGSIRKKTDIIMDGFGVFSFAVKDVPREIKELVENSDIETEDVDYLVLHQANKFMMNHICKKVKIDLEKMPITVDKFGNSSSSTIPVVMASELKNDMTTRNLNILMSGFGAGLSIASCLLKLSELEYVNLIEV
jgi:3-oxoacyl-[acyl-carrier-protein] synthase-3